VNESELLVDTWAWREHLNETASGASLRQRIEAEANFRTHTSAVRFTELSARLTAAGASERIAAACGAIHRPSHICDGTSDLA
jgi:hypothetical protein